MKPPENAKVRNFAPGSSERASVEAELARQRANPRDVDPIINGERLRMGQRTRIFEPHAHERSLGTFGSAGAREAQLAVDAANKARQDWANLSASARRSVFLRAAHLLEGPFNDRLMAATIAKHSIRRKLMLAPNSSTFSASMLPFQKCWKTGNRARRGLNATGWSCARLMGMYLQCPPSTSRQSPEISALRRLSWATRLSGSRRNAAC